MTDIAPTTARFPNTAALSANGTHGTVNALMQWWPDRALQVDLVITTGAQPIRWNIGRDLLTAGLDAPVGIGDLSIMPDLPSWGHRVELVLRDQHGIGRNLAIVLPVAAVRRFLDATYQRVPAGAEAYVFDMAELSGEATA